MGRTWAALNTMTARHHRRGKQSEWKRDTTHPQRHRGRGNERTPRDGRSKPIELEPRDSPRRFNKLTAERARIKNTLPRPPWLRGERGKARRKKSGKSPSNERMKKKPGDPLMCRGGGWKLSGGTGASKQIKGRTRTVALPHHPIDNIRDLPKAEGLGLPFYGKPLSFVLASKLGHLGSPCV